MHLSASFLNASVLNPYFATGLHAGTQLIFRVFKLQTNKHLPLHMRRKTCPEKAIPLVFEIIPSNGALLPGQHQNVQVKFMPREKV